MLTEQEVIDKVNARYKFETPSKGGPRPHKISVQIYGNHASYVQDGIRIWGFVSEKGRNKFAVHYKAGTLVCE